MDFVDASSPAPTLLSAEPAPPLARLPSPPRLPAASRAALALLFRLTRSTPGLLPLLRPLAVGLTLVGCGSVRRSTRANARRLLGPAATARQRRRYARGVVGSFFDFVVETGWVQHRSVQQLRAGVDHAESRATYLQSRGTATGAIVLTAHVGSFETGLALLTEVEHRVHVVFKRDAMDGFEQIRSRLRHKFGVREAPIDDGWPTWISLRDALEADEVVVMQGDRVWPGQKSATVPLCDGHVRLPLGPFKLAQITGSCIIPIFTLRTPGGGWQVVIESPLHVDPADDLLHGSPPALLKWASVLQGMIRQHPQQWLVLHRAFVEDAVDS